MSILIINSGSVYYGSLFAYGISHYCNAKSYGYSSYPNYNIDIFSEHIEKYNIERVNFDQFDCIIGVDHGCLQILSELKKKYPNKKYVCQILDYPKHVFKKTKDYNKSVKYRWDTIYQQIISRMDILLCNQQNSIPYIKSIAPNSKVEFVRYPVFPVQIEDYQRKDFIVYSGRIHPDKGVHYIIDALSVVEDDIELVTIGSGFDFSDYAKYLGVRYKNISDCSEYDKWKIYHESRFVVCGADNPYIPALCILEGISIGRCGVVFDYKENRLHYQEFAWYNIPRNIDSMANCISCIFNDINLGDSRAMGGPLFAQEECTHNAWGKRVFNIIEESK